MTIQSKPLLLSIVLAIAIPVYAANLTNTQLDRSDPAGSAIEGSILSTSDRMRAQLWDLSETEWQRYRQLMKGVRGSISPATISPIEVLGIHARDEAERQRYAETWARTMYEDAGRILAFQQAYDEAVKRLHPNQPLIDISRLPGKSSEATEFQSADRVLFFTRQDCPACDLILNKLLKRLDEISGLDIYLTDVPQGDDSIVRDWASIHSIDPAWVHSRRITLNHDGGALNKLTQGDGEAPSLFRRRGEELSPIRAADL
ncbi:MAG: TIGR03759 family integrating conjugative element protein [Candidatus Thiodiazotropha endolucinida]|jgi:integrating conjugative element protein (TIGR03759 family)|nr:TIGR03759 family integrating conjugative element protein [Candidatus Thiodiazotropha endolucinida]